MLDRFGRWFDRDGWRRSIIGIPYLWLGLFFLLPFLIVLAMSLATRAMTAPPFAFAPDWPFVDLVNYRRLFEDDLYLRAFLVSVGNALTATLFCLALGYPMALGLTRVGRKWRTILLMLVILPFWTSFLLRVYAWQGFLRSNGIINNFLFWTGIIDQPLVMLQTDFAVYLGIVYTYLPFMILPLYANLVKLDESLLEASADLGGRPLSTFFHVTLPLSMPGVIAGFMLVFVPAIGEFVIPELLGGPDTLMIGRVLWNEFFSNRDWPVASAVAIAMLIAVVVPIMILRLIQARVGEE